MDHDSGPLLRGGGVNRLDLGPCLPACYGNPSGGLRVNSEASESEGRPVAAVAPSVAPTVSKPLKSLRHHRLSQYLVSVALQVRGSTHFST
jgi:hypothetical protein